MPPKIVDPESLTFLRQQLLKCKDIDIARHFAGSPLQDLPEKLDDTLGISMDLEWHKHLPQDKIIEVGFVVFRMSILRDCKSPADFVSLMKKTAVYHMRIVETAHMRNTGTDDFGISFNGTERNSIYAPTRFVHQSEALSVLKTFLDDQRCDDGSKKPVMLIGQGFRFDEEHLKSEWDWDIRKLDSVVYTFKSLTGLGKRAGIFPEVERSQAGERDGDLRFNEILTGFGVETEGLSLHNGANDAVYEFLVFALIVLHPILYPGAYIPFPANSSINGQSLNEVLDEVALAKQKVQPPTWGYAKYCFYCEVADDHDSEEKEACKAVLKCTLCASAPGSQNKRYLSKQNRMGHTVARCVHQYKHFIPSLPDWVLELLPEADDQRAFSRAVAIRDRGAMADLVFDKVLPPGLLGTCEVEAQDEADKKEMLRLWNLDVPEDGEVENLAEWEGEDLE
jgi:hypothetical protein